MNCSHDLLIDLCSHHIYEKIVLVFRGILLNRFQYISTNPRHFYLVQTTITDSLIKIMFQMFLVIKTFIPIQKLHKHLLYHVFRFILLFQIIKCKVTKCLIITPKIAIKHPLFSYIYLLYFLHP